MEWCRGEVGRKAVEGRVWGEEYGEGCGGGVGVRRENLNSSRKAHRMGRY